VEFDKALVNLTANLFGQLAAIDDQGKFRPLTVAEVLASPNSAEIPDLVAQVVAVGKAVRAYESDESPGTIRETMIASAGQHADHVPSSLQWIEGELRRGTLQPRLTPTEAWLLEPLIRYAHAAGLEESAHYFEELVRRTERKLATAISRR
jgi:hypothetical protein